MLRDLILDLTPNLLASFYFHTGINLTRTRRGPIPIDDLRRICVLTTSGIGNLILLTPMLFQLRTKIPQARLHLVTANEAAKDLLAGTDLVDHIWIDSRRRRFWREARAEWYDLTIAATHRGFMRAKQAFRTGARYRIGFRYPYRDQQDTDFLLTHAVDYVMPVHEAEQGMRLLQPLGIRGESRLHLPILPTEQHKVKQLFPETSPPLIALHPLASKEPRKAWPLENYRALIKHIQTNTEASVILTGGPEDSETMATMAVELGVVSVAGKLTLRETAAVLQRCSLFIGHDGAPMHLSAAVGTPVIALFGPTDPTIYGPYGDGHTVLRSGRPCAPCHEPHSGRFQCDTNICMQTITVEQVWDAVKAQL